MWICLRLFFPHDGSENASRRSSYYVEDVGFPTSGRKKRYVGTQLKGPDCLTQPSPLYLNQLLN